MTRRLPASFSRVLKWILLVRARALSLLLAACAETYSFHAERGAAHKSSFSISLSSLSLVPRNYNIHHGANNPLYSLLHYREEAQFALIFRVSNLVICARAEFCSTTGDFSCDALYRFIPHALRLLFFFFFFYFIINLHHFGGVASLCFP